MSILELCDELSVLSAFVRDLDENNELNPPVREVIYPALVERMKEIVNLLGDEN